jgi:hypothetical protein
MAFFLYNNFQYLETLALMYLVIKNRLALLLL